MCRPVQCILYNALPLLAGKSGTGTIQIANSPLMIQVVLFPWLLMAWIRIKQTCQALYAFLSPVKICGAWEPILLDVWYMDMDLWFLTIFPWYQPYIDLYFAHIAWGVQGVHITTPPTNSDGQLCPRKQKQICVWISCLLDRAGNIHRGTLFIVIAGNSIYDFLKYWVGFPYGGTYPWGYRPIIQLLVPLPHKAWCIDNA